MYTLRSEQDVLRIVQHKSEIAKVKEAQCNESATEGTKGMRQPIPVVLTLCSNQTQRYPN